MKPFLLITTIALFAACTKSNDVNTAAVVFEYMTDTVTSLSAPHFCSEVHYSSWIKTETVQYVGESLPLKYLNVETFSEIQLTDGSWQRKFRMGLKFVSTILNG